MQKACSYLGGSKYARDITIQSLHVSRTLSNPSHMDLYNILLNRGARHKLNCTVMNPCFGKATWLDQIGSFWQKRYIQLMLVTFTSASSGSHTAPTLREK